MYILVVEDDKAIAELLRFNLEKEGYNVQIVDDGERAVEKAITTTPDLILMDWMLPEKSGLEAIHSIRSKADKHIPIIMLTARSEEDDKVQSLDIGADDYIVKPFSPRELMARIRAVLRRFGKEETSILTFQNIELDIQARIVKRDGEVIKVGLKEYELLSLLMQNPKRVFTREQLLDAVWGHDVYVESRTVDVHITRLRKALGKGDIIRTIWSVGYGLV